MQSQDYKDVAHWTSASEDNAAAANGSRSSGPSPPSPLIPSIPHANSGGIGDDGPLMLQSTKQESTKLPLRFSPTLPALSYQDLYLLDMDILLQMGECRRLWECSLTSPVDGVQSICSIRSLREKEIYLNSTCKSLKDRTTSLDNATMTLKTAMVERIKENIQIVRGYITGLEKPTVAPGSARSFDTSKFVNKPVLNLHRIYLSVLYIVLAMSLLAKLSRSLSNGLLRLLGLFLEDVWRDKGGPTPDEAAILDDFPKDIRSVRKAFDLEPTTIIWACCPKCSFTHRSFPEKPPCNARLTTRKVQKGESVRVPIRPYPVQDFDAFVASLLCRPGIEDVIRKGMDLVLKQEDFYLQDVIHGSALREIKGPDGRAFADGPAEEI
ncbi:hypothetical protein A0H81_12046 [Grifola frondosa]|uniref:Uncharacterized protein n=1 Tax=Grifola frondosa TaxID=5627 RepID=A0A1C7LW24_GRIFR|nr:hypothetical protein A0H81_12046 [Grifola frondosa]